MALKSRLTKAEFDALPDVLKEHYKESGGNYVLDSDDANELRAAKDREVEAARQARERADALQAKLDEAEAERVRADEEAARSKKDIPAIEASWQAKVDAEKIKGEETAKKLREQLQELLVDNKAQELAAKISKSPKLIMPHIKARLKAELEGDAAITRVLDANGNASAMNMDDLEKEFVANPDFADIIKGTNANGGGANGNGSNGGAGSKKLSELTEKERTDLARNNPAEFQRMKQAAGMVY